MKDSNKRQFIYTVLTAALLVCPLLSHADVGAAQRVEFVLAEGMQVPEVVLQESDNSKQKYTVNYDKKDGDGIPSVIYVSDMDLRDSKHFSWNVDEKVLIADVNNPYMKGLLGLIVIPGIRYANWAIRPVAGGNNLFVHHAFVVPGVQVDEDGYDYAVPGSTEESQWLAFKNKAKIQFNDAPSGFYNFDDQNKIMHIHFNALKSDQS